MERLVYIVAFLVIAQKVLECESLEIKSLEDLNRFYESWARSDNVEAFREKQRQYTMQLMNSSVDPCDNFFEFACGNFGSIVPENRTWNYTSHLKLMGFSQEYLQRKLLEDEVDPLENEAFRKVKNFYQSCVDNSAWNLEFLTNFVKNFAVWPILQETPASGEFDWLNVTARAAQYEVFPMFKINFGEGTLKPGPRFYNDNDDIFNLTEFKKKASKLSIDLTGKDPDLTEVGNFVSKITNLQNESGLLGWYKQFNFSDLSKKVPGIDFRRYLQIYKGVRSWSLNETVSVVEPIYFEDLSDIISQTDSKVVANYVFVRFVERAASIWAELTGDGLSKACTKVVTDTMKSAMIGLYAKHYFDENAHSQIKALVEGLQTEGRRVINESEWITPETKVKALEKISGVTKHIGLPDHYRNTSLLVELYKDLEIDRNNFLHSFFNALRVKSRKPAQTEEALSKEFLTDPLVVNAFFALYGKGILEIPAAVLQQPIFHKHSARYVNFGGVGAAVGHEFMHGFDDQGILYDENGIVGIWWDPRISSTYYTRAGCYYQQYGEFKVDRINQTLDGGTTLGENVADNEGLKLTLNAYKRWLAENDETSNIEYNGQLLTPVQSFYLAFAQNYCSAFTQEELKEQIEKDVHAPGVIRVLGTLSNSPDFADAYKCPLGSKMNPEQKCKYLRK